MATLTYETTLIVHNDDVAKILTDALCEQYGPMSRLHVATIQQNSEGDFVLTLDGKETEA